MQSGLGRARATGGELTLVSEVTEVPALVLRDPAPVPAAEDVPACARARPLSASRREHGAKPRLKSGAEVVGELVAKPRDDLQLACNAVERQGIVEPRN